MQLARFLGFVPLPQKKKHGVNGIEITYGHDELVVGIYTQVLMESDHNMSFACFCGEWDTKLIGHSTSVVVRQFTGFNVTDVQVPWLSAGAIQNCRYVLSVYADRLLLNPEIGLNLVSRELGIDPICVHQWMRCVGLTEEEMQKAARLLQEMRPVDENARINVKPHRISDDNISRFTLCITCL